MNDNRNSKEKNSRIQELIAQITNINQTHRKNKEAYIPQQAEKDRGKKTLVLDLDETLIHSFKHPIANPRIKFCVYFWE
jgi:TFIIF-interacting CTD phosphatase-like protein